MVNSSMYSAWHRMWLTGLVVGVCTVVGVGSAAAQVTTIKGSSQKQTAPRETAAHASQAHDNLIIIDTDETVVDGEVVIISTDRPQVFRREAAGTVSSTPLSITPEDYRQQVRAQQPQMLMHGHDDRTSGIAVIRGGGHDRPSSHVHTGIIYQRQQITRGTGGSGILYRYQVTPYGREFIYYRNDGAGLGYLHRQVTREAHPGNFHGRHGFRPYHPRYRYHDGVGPMRPSVQFNAGNRAGRLIIRSDEP